MLIDWFTVIAQVVNFLILVWLLKRFLYQPILNAIDAREKRIAKELADADAKTAEAIQARDEFQHKKEEFDRQRAALLSKATDEATAKCQRLLDDARQAADALSAKRQEMLRNDAHNLNQAISRRTQQEVFAIARKALMDLATTSPQNGVSDTISFGFTLTQNVPVQVTVQRAGTTVATLFTGQLGPGVQTVGWDGSSAGTRLPDGQYTAVVTATDPLAAVSLLVPFAIDTIPPVLTLADPASVRFELSEPATITGTINGQPVTAGEPAGPFVFPFPGPATSWSLTARDAAGNPGAPLTMA